MYFEELKLGAKVEIAPVKIDKQEMMEFARKYDNIPLHTDEKYAETTRFGRLIAPGMMTFLVMWASYLPCEFAAEQLIAGKSSKIEWFAPVYADDELHGTVEITALTPRNPYNGIMEVTIDVFNQDNKLVLRNVTESVVERLPSEHGGICS